MKSNPEEELPEILPTDEPPKGGVWADEHAELTEEEIAAGNELGSAIDVDDDTDNGLDR